MRLGNKKIFHLEAWVVKVMSLYKVRPTFCSALLAVSSTDHGPVAFLLQYRHGRVR